MNDSVIKDCWNVILQKDSRLFNDSRLPLFNIHDYLAYFKLPPLPPMEMKMDAATDIRSTEPGFSNLTDEILIGLRCNIYAGTKLDTVALWAEKLMRFCEIRYATLKQRSVEKWNNPTSAQLHLLHLSVFFLDYAVCANDARFLNTILKLADLKWVIHTKTIKQKLSSVDQDFVSALFQFRILLITEYAMEQLRKGRAL
jgi:hypothetical protein